MDPEQPGLGPAKIHWTSENSTSLNISRSPWFSLQTFNHQHQQNSKQWQQLHLTTCLSHQKSSYSRLPVKHLMYGSTFSASRSFTSIPSSSSTTLLSFESSSIHQTSNVSTSDSETGLTAVEKRGGKVTSFRYDWVTQIDEDGEGWHLVCSEALQKVCDLACDLGDF